MPSPNHLKSHGLQATKSSYNILQQPLKGYTSHTWHWSSANNLLNTNVNFINLNWYGQWISDSMGEGNIVNLKHLSDKQLDCIIPKGTQIKR